MTSKRTIGLVGVAGLALASTVIIIFQEHTQQPHPAAQPASPALISRHVPAFASSENTPAAQANDDSYDTAWRSQGAPAWLAYDLSSVPAARRSKVLVVWYNESYNYDHTLNGSYAYNLPQDYTLQAHPAPGGSAPPATGWVTLATVTGNHYHSRQHVLEMAGNTWLRMVVTAVDGAPENMDASLNLDVYDAEVGMPDDWIFFGDSLTAGAMGHLSVEGTPAFTDLIHAQVPSQYPVQESGGIGYLTSADGARWITTWLPMFPGHYVGLSYGTNDANGCVDAATFSANYRRMVQAVLDAGKVPVIPHLPWGRTPNIQRCGPALNAAIDRLYQAYPQIIKGPDLWAFFQQYQNLISPDNIHPTEAGFAAYRTEWASAMLREVYKRG